MLADGKMFLDALRRSIPERAMSREASDAINAQSVLLVAEKMQRIFQLPVADAPALLLVGGLVDGGDFAPAGHAPASISVTGTGFDLWQATISCVCEAVEFLSQLAPHDREFVVGTPGEVPHGLERQTLASLLAMLGMDGEELAMPLKWAEAKLAPGDAQVLVPAALCYRNLQHPDNRQARIKLSSGCGAGATRESALLHALLELVERDAVALWWLGGRRGAALAESGVPAALQRELQRRVSSRITWLLDITTDLGLPCVAALSTDADGRAFAAGFAARLSYAEAIRAAVFEMCQMEVGLSLILLKHRQGGDGALNDVERKHLRRAFGFDVRDCALLFPCDEASRGTRSLPESTIGSPRELAQRLEAAGIQAFWVELTRPNLAIPAVRALAPALQPYPTEMLTPRLQRQIQQTGEGFGLTSGIPLM